MRVGGEAWRRLVCAVQVVHPVVSLMQSRHDAGSRIALGMSAQHTSRTCIMLALHL